MHQRTVFFVSDGTGITAQSLGQLLAHFPDMVFRQVRLPFTNSVEKVNDAVQQFGMRGWVVLDGGIVEVASGEGLGTAACAKPGRASYSARMAITGLPAPYSATKAVGIPAMPRVTLKPSASSVSARSFDD